MKILDRELTHMVPQGGSLLVSERRFGKAQLAHVERKYRSNVGVGELRVYYASAFARTGWRHVKDAAITSWGASESASVSEYCREPYTAEIEFAGRSNKEWSYSVSLVWDASRTRCNH